MPAIFQNVSDLRPQRVLAPMALAISEIPCAAPLHQCPASAMSIGHFLRSF
jgi:hypothetical protein